VVVRAQESIAIAERCGDALGVHGVLLSAGDMKYMMKCLHLAMTALLFSTGIAIPSAPASLPLFLASAARAARPQARAGQRVLQEEEEEVASHLAALANCCVNRTVRLEMPPASVAPFVFVGHDSDGKPEYTGYLVDTIKILSDYMGFALEFVSLAGWDPAKVIDLLLDGKLDTTLVEESTVEAGYSLPPLSNELVYSSPLHISVYSGLANRSSAEPSRWALFDPFTLDMWIAIIVTVFTAAACLVIIDMIRPVNFAGERNRAFTKGRLREFCTASYHSWAAMLDGDDYVSRHLTQHLPLTCVSGRVSPTSAFHPFPHTPRSWCQEWISMPTRILRLALLLVVVIFLATYTANLASFFTRQSVRVSGPSSLQEFVESPAALKPACFLTKEEAQKFVGYGVRMDGSTIYPNVADDDDADTLIEWCHAALRDGRAGIIVGVSELLAHYIFATPERCQTLVFQEWMRLAPARYSLAFRAEDKEFVGLLSTAIDSLSKTWTYVQKQQEWLYLGRTCTAAAAVTDDDTQPVGFYAMSGLFIIAGSVAGLAVLMAAITRLWSVTGRSRTGPASALRPPSPARVQTSRAVAGTTTVGGAARWCGRREPVSSTPWTRRGCPKRSASSTTARSTTIGRTARS
jgi:hypothetical protein